jgi:hypothetical protein
MYTFVRQEMLSRSCNVILPPNEKAYRPGRDPRSLHEQLVSSAKQITWPGPVQRRVRLGCSNWFAGASLT